MNAIKPRSDLRQRDVRRRFDRAADRFHEADFVHRVTREGLLDRIGRQVNLEFRVITQYIRFGLRLVSDLVNVIRCI